MKTGLAASFGNAKGHMSKRITFLISKQLGLKILEASIEVQKFAILEVITIDDSHDSRCELKAIQELCKNHSIKCSIAQSRKDSERLVAESNPDTVMVCGWYWIISSKLLQTVPGGFFGLHFSELPKFRGSAPLVWTILSGQQLAGASFFQFREGIDDGPIAAQIVVPIAENDDVGILLAKLTQASLRCWKDLLPKIATGTLRLKEQNHENATYCSTRRPEHGLIDWSLSSSELHNFIRAQTTPYPGAYTYYKGEVLRIWKATPYPNKYYSNPGQVISRDLKGVLVGCGQESALWILCCQIEDQSRRTPYETILSLKDTLGS